MAGRVIPSASHKHRSLRLAGYDYTRPGAYFVTIGTCQHECIFGEIIGGAVILNEIGIIVRDEWLKTQEIRKEIRLDVFQIMPNHVHGIIFIEELNEGESNVGAHGRAPLRPGSQLFRQPRSLGSLVAGFKSVTTKRINILRNTPGSPVWQRNYYEHVIRTKMN